jgi:hypothetical protein
MVCFLRLAGKKEAKNNYQQNYRAMPFKVFRF